MRIYNLYIISLSGVLLLSSVVMTAMNADSLSNYYSVFTLEAFCITELFVHLDPKAKRGLGVVSVLMFTAFLIALGIQTQRILGL